MSMVQGRKNIRIPMDKVDSSDESIKAHILAM